MAPRNIAARSGYRSVDAFLQQSTIDNTETHPLWMWIRISSERVSFNEYSTFLERVLCDGIAPDGCAEEQKLKHGERGSSKWREWFHGVEAYDLLKKATEAFLLIRCACACAPFRSAISEAGGEAYEQNCGHARRSKGSSSPTQSAELSGVAKADDAPSPSYGDNPQTTSDGCNCESDELKEGKFADAETFADEFERLGDTSLSDPNVVITKLASYLGTTDHSYIQTILKAAFGDDWATQLNKSPFCGKLLCSKVTCPSLLELIWSYWHEEAMLVQTLNAVSVRFQNKRLVRGRDPLAELELDPLRPLNNFLWGYIQDEIHRLTVPRRAYEYSHHYGLTLDGRAVPALRAADNRSKFIEAFHDLLYRAAIFFREDADTTVISDGFPLLNALKEVHLLLAQGAHNQFGDLPWTARVEMMMQQWLLAQPQMREFLGARVMVPYEEPWMGRVDTMKKLQGWSDVSVTHFRNLGVFGERLLLSIRYANWNSMADQDNARTWGRYWKQEIQGYIHAYRAVTGVDLTSEPVDSTLPSVLLRRRLSQQQAALAR